LQVAVLRVGGGAGAPDEFSRPHLRPPHQHILMVG